MTEYTKQELFDYLRDKKKEFTVVILNRGFFSFNKLPNDNYKLVESGDNILFLGSTTNVIIQIELLKLITSKHFVIFK